MSDIASANARAHVTGLLNDPLNRPVMRNYRITHGCADRYESRSSSRAKLRNGKPQPIASICFCIALAKRGECIANKITPRHIAQTPINIERVVAPFAANQAFGGSAQNVLAELASENEITVVCGVKRL